MDRKKRIKQLTDYFYHHGTIGFLLNKLQPCLKYANAVIFSSMAARILEEDPRYEINFDELEFLLEQVLLYLISEIEAPEEKIQISLLATSIVQQYKKLYQHYYNGNKILRGAY